MGNNCHKSSKKQKNLNPPSDLSQPPLLKSDKRTKQDATVAEITIEFEKDPVKIFQKFVSTNLTDFLSKGTLKLNQYLTHLKDLDIDIIVAIIKKFDILDIIPINPHQSPSISISDMKNENLRKIEEDYEKFKENSKEYQSKYLALPPKESIEIAIKLIQLYIETYHFSKFLENQNEISLQNPTEIHKKENQYKFFENQTQSDYEYLKVKFSELDREIAWNFKGNGKNQEKNHDFHHVVDLFINEVFVSALKKYDEENFVESWGFDHGEKFGVESDHAAFKCFDYKFEIRMMNHF